jgi:hypothetical protein
MVGPMMTFSSQHLPFHHLESCGRIHDYDDPCDIYPSEEDLERAGGSETIDLPFVNITITTCSGCGKVSGMFAHGLEHVVDGQVCGRFE